VLVFSAATSQLIRSVPNQSMGFRWDFERLVEVTGRQELIYYGKLRIAWVLGILFQLCSFRAINGRHIVEFWQVRIRGA
jgi:hypothetical protein